MEKINVAELLKDCPKGMELDCAIYEDVVFHDIVDRHYPIRVRRKQGGLVSLNAYGCIGDKIDSKCVIFPKDKTTWEGFVPPCQFKDGDVVTSVFQGVVQGTGIFEYEEQSEAWIHACVNHDNEFSTYGYLGHVYNLRLAIEEEKQKLFDTIKENGYRWNAETKTLEKLIEPKFKVGDRVRHKKTNKNDVYEISKVYDDSYGLVGFTWMLYMKYQDDYELVPNKFDINTLVPFESKVLVRSTNDDIWRPAIYGFTDSDRYYVVGGIYWKQCIPYDVNKELLGTTNNPKEYGSE